MCLKGEMRNIVSIAIAAVMLLCASCAEKAPAKPSFPSGPEGTEPEINQIDSFRVLCIGNEITFCAPDQELGWRGNWGLAATCRDNDYVHQLGSMLNNDRPTAVTALDLREWEKDMSADPGQFLGSSLDGTDLVVIKLGENVSKASLLASGFANLIKTCREKTDSIVIVGNFYQDSEGVSKDEVMRSIAAQNSLPFCSISKVIMTSGIFPKSTDEYEAINGDTYSLPSKLCIYPNDKAMRLIAEAVYESYRNWTPALPGKVFENYPLPNKPDTLKILALGNSFSNDATFWLPRLMTSAGIGNVVVGRMYIGGCSLQKHCEKFESNAADYTYSKNTRNGWTDISTSYTLKEALQADEWDIVTMQQNSGLSGLWGSYIPYLEKLVGIVRKECPKAAIVWHQTWAYASNSKLGAFGNYENNQTEMANAIEGCTRLVQASGIPVVIPSGSSVRRMRSSSYCADTEFSYDTQHLSPLGKYIAACAWYRALIEPVFGKKLSANTYRMEDTQYSIPVEEATFIRTAVEQAFMEFYQEPSSE